MYIRLIKRPTNVGNNKNRNRGLEDNHWLVRNEKRKKFLKRNISKDVEQD